MTSYLTSIMETISLSFTVFEKMSVTILKTAQKVRLDTILLPEGVVWDIAHKNRFGRLGCTRVRDKDKKHTILSACISVH